ncbi:methyl-accepting chemotaxis protein [Natrinema zhouii]|uniref:Chemotaxis protein n=1 Tax=Natrinema zhouii TaxID=1710539 RepID=A0A7D6H513_9EURY|nr:methyl-accepting chemotaxis protein [Natrinema zhouii]QLK27487.1 methyl-accepting chemotaxis protein [Natrinema zhouii]
MSRPIRQLIPDFIRKRYALKFAIALLAIGLIVGGIGTFATGEITAQTENSVNSEYQSLASSEAKTISRWQDRNEMATRSTSTSETLRSEDSSEVTLFLQNKQSELFGDAHATHVIDHDTENKRVIGSTTMKSDVSFQDDERDWLNSVVLDQVSEVYVSDVYDVGGTPVVGFVSPIGGGENRMLVLEVRVSDIAGDFQGGERADGGFTMVVNNKGNVVFDENTERVLTEYGDKAAMEPVRLGEELRGSMDSFEQQAGVVQMSATPTVIDEPYTVGYAPVEGTNWVVVTHAPTSEVYGFVQTVQDFGYIATFAGVAAIVLIGAVLGRNTATAIDRLTGKTKQMEEGDLEVDLSSSRIDSIGQLYGGFASMRDSLKTQIHEAESARMEAEQAREETERINQSLEQKADEYSTVMQAAGDGDFTARMDAESDNEAMAAIGSEFNEMIAEIERTVAELNRFATDVATASEQVTASSEEVRSASQQVTGSIQEISDGAERQDQSLQSVNQEMSGLSTTTEEIAASSNEVADIAERTVDTGQEGQEAAQAAITAMDDIEDGAGGAVTEIRRLEEEVQQIDELINTISEIARQTNMLALNANIEASRSAGGKDDEGFSVVAKEVKALSEDVAEAADEAEDRLESIRERTEESAAEVEGTSDDIENASEQVQEAVQALEQIAQLAQETNVGVQEISAATEEQAASTQEVVAMIDDAATISEETTAESENVAAAAEEQTTAMTEVTKSASNLSQQAAQLSEALDRFDTDVDPDDANLESMIDTDAELAATESTLEVDTEAASGPDAENRGITFETDDEPSETDSDNTLTFDDSADDTHEARMTDSAADATDTDQSVADILGNDSVDEAPEPVPADTSVEPSNRETDQGTDADPTADGEHDGDSGEIGAEEILGIEDRDGGATDPLAAETSDPLATDDHDTSPGFEPADESAIDTDTAAQQSEPVDDRLDDGSVDGTDSSHEQEPAAGGDSGAESDEPTVDSDATETSDDEDDESSDSDDVFTFGTAPDDDE